jgi:hypothetical protein
MFFSFPSIYLIAALNAAWHGLALISQYPERLLIFEQSPWLKSHHNNKELQSAYAALPMTLHYPIYHYEIQLPLPQKQ